MMTGGRVITESLGFDKDARQAEICAKSKADILSLPLFLASQQSSTVTRLCHQYHCHQYIGRPRCVHALTMGPCPQPSPLGLTRGPWITFSGPPVSGFLGCVPGPCQIHMFHQKCSPYYQWNQPCRFSAANSSLHPPLCSLSQVLEQETLHEMI